MRTRTPLSGNVAAQVILIVIIFLSSVRPYSSTVGARASRRPGLKVASSGCAHRGLRDTPVHPPIHGAGPCETVLTQFGNHHEWTSTEAGVVARGPPQAVAVGPRAPEAGGRPERAPEL